MNITLRNRVLRRKQENMKRNNYIPKNVRRAIFLSRKNSKPTKGIRLELEREYNLHTGLIHLNKKYGFKRIMDWYWEPNYITNGLPETTDGKDPDFSQDLKLIHTLLQPKYSKITLQPKEMLNYFVEQVEIVTDKILQKYPKLNPITEVERYALFRYWTVGALNNISLSVSPDIKRKWGINFELFGSFYNTHYSYCGLFPELEKRCVSDVFHFELEPNMTILVNPPYTEEWIQKSCELVTNYLEQNMNTTIWLVVPVWNRSDRKILGLKNHDDMPILDAMKFSLYLRSHEITNLPFYNGLEKKEIHLKDNVHVYKLSNVNIMPGRYMLTSKHNTQIPNFKGETVKKSSPSRFTMINFPKYKKM